MYSEAATLGNFVIIVIFQLLQVRQDGINITLSEIWSAIRLSLYLLYHGVHPDRDHTGRLYTAADGELFRLRLQPLAGGICWGALGIAN